ncbi:MAG TPA: cyclic-di-AMP receptor [Anaerolineales bacterium]|nr:cyclic-di-AMP receptor [Anaerolineales bacterium]
MKMIVCILQDSDKDKASDALNENGYSVTIIPSTGAYFRRGNATMIAGVEDDQVDDAISIIREAVKREDEPELKRATLFVINVDQYSKV